jgi:mannonate dehydratase
MKLGLGLHRHMLTRENLTFARQVGATHLVAHLAAETRAVAPTDPLPPPTPKDS